MADSTQQILLQVDIDSDKLNQKLQQTLDEITDLTNAVSALKDQLKQTFKDNNADDINDLVEALTKTEGEINNLTKAAANYISLLPSFNSNVTEQSKSVSGLTDEVNLLSGSLDLAKSAEGLFGGESTAVGEGLGAIAGESALASTGIGLVVVAVTELIAHWGDLMKLLSDVSVQQEALNDINQKTVQGFANKKTEIEILYDKSKNLSLSYEERVKAVDGLHKIAPDILKDLTAENAGTEAMANTINNILLPSLEKEAKAEAAKQKLKELTLAQLNMELEAQQNAAKQYHVDLSQDDGSVEFGRKKNLVNEAAKEALQASGAYQDLGKQIEYVLEIAGENDKAKTGDDPTLTRLRNEKLATEATVDAAKKGTKEELDARIDLFNKEEQIELQELGNLADHQEQKKAIEARYNRQKQEADEQFYKQYYDENTNKALIKLEEQHQKGNITEEKYQQDKYNITQDGLTKLAALYAKDNSPVEQQKVLDTIKRNQIAHNTEMERLNKASADKQKEEATKQAEETRQQTENIADADATEDLANLQQLHEQGLISDEKYLEESFDLQKGELEFKMSLYDKDSDDYKKLNTEKLKLEAQHQDALTAAAKKGIQDRVKAEQDKFKAQEESIRDKIKSDNTDKTSDPAQLQSDKNSVDGAFDKLKTEKEQELAFTAATIGTENDLYKAQADELTKIDDDRHAYDLAQTEKTEKAKAEITKRAEEEGKALLGAVQSALKEAEDEELAAAGNNAQKKKEIQKKYALYELAVKSANIIASTAEAVAANSKYTVAAPVLDAIAIATGAIEEGVAIAQYNKVASMAKGGIIGGKPHSQGGTKFYGTDGTMFEAERGELIAVMNRNSTDMLSRFSAFNQMGGGVSFFGNNGVSYAADGGLIARNVSAPVEQNFAMEKFGAAVGNAISNLPTPVVRVQDIIYGVNNRITRVDDRVNI